MPDAVPERGKMLYAVGGYDGSNTLSSSKRYDPRHKQLDTHRIYGHRAWISRPHHAQQQPLRRKAATQAKSKAQQKILEKAGKIPKLKKKLPQVMYNVFGA